jgi:hypothetical protein
MKAEWKKRDFNKHPHPPQDSYELFEELTFSNGDVIARIEQFKSSPLCYYATTPNERSGCLRSYEWARQWCEAKTNNRPQ